MLRRVFCKLLLVAIVIFSLLALTSAVMAQGRSEAFERVKEVQERHTLKLMAKPGVVGTAIGLNDKGRHVILIFLERPGVAGIPQELEGVPVKQKVTGKIYAFVDRTARLPRPVPIGVSTGHPDITAGTIACRVYDDDNMNGIRDVDEDVFALSNNHVYADENLAEIGDPVIQPGTYDGGLSPADDIGTLAAYEEIKFDGSPNIIDAAIASTTTTLVHNATPSDGYGTPKSTTATVTILQSVQKYGRTTGLTSGMVFGANSAVNVQYSSGVAYFENQIMIYGNFSAGGDSGSLVVTDPDKEPVGLLFAGGGGYTFANPIGPVLSRFGVKIDGSEVPANNPPVADFAGSPTSGDVPLSVNFTDLSTGGPTSWSWDFGDGVGASTARNPSYTYNTVGTYSVTLTATNAYGSDVETKVAYINVTEPASDPIIADFEGNPISGNAPLTVNFTDLSSGDPVSWGWDFGDGVGASFAQNPSYTYVESGTYDVTLIVANIDLYMDMVTKYNYITVTEPTGNPPTANFSANQTSGEAPLTVQFTDLSTDNPTSWSWDFGDGIGTSTAQNPSYEYASVGTYTVTLTATNIYGSDTVDRVDYITVSEPSVEITLTAIGYKVRGRKTTDLEWSGATGELVEIYRDGIPIVTTENDGFYHDATDSRGGGSFTYQVCEIDGSLCSNVVTVYY